MRLTPGTSLGPYEVLSVLGAGGMGEVYRALDTKLGRQVAIKVLPESFATDANRRGRFQREAQLLASLNHPHIAAIYGVEEDGGLPALVLELVEGETLAERITRAPLSVADALRLASQIADALEAAHARGIVHRDLKPANVKITPGGAVKVLDFGLAKMLDAAASDGDVPAASLSMLPTISSPVMTGADMLLGTAAYMSPEQANCSPADKRTDIWAFGVVLYEMLTGRRAFDGATTVEVLSNVLKTEPDMTVPAETPAAVRSLLRHCLQKEQSRRFRDIGDARLLIEEALIEPTSLGGPPAVAPKRTIGERWLWAMLVVAVVAAVAAATWGLRRAAPPAAEVRLEVSAPATTELTSIAVSPDGKSLVFVGTSEGQSRLWVRPLDATSARPLPGTENARYPFWSPDSRSVGFSADAQLKRIDLQRGAVRVLASGGAWNRDGTILYAQSTGAPGLLRVSADGGAPQRVTHTTSQANDHQSPQFLPDHRHFLFYTTGSEPGIYVTEVGASNPPRRILEAQAATYAASGHLLFVREGTLFAQAFDAERLELTGSPTPIAERIAGSDGMAALSASPAGPIVYRTGPPQAQHHFVWVDRSGATLDTVAGSDFGDAFHASLSPDGSRLAMSRVDGTADIWLLDVNRGVRSRLTFDAAFDLTPEWSPDGRRIAFTSNRRGPTQWGLYMKAASGTSADELLDDRGAGTISPTDWSPDGRFILYVMTRPNAARDIWAQPLEGDRKSFTVLATPFNETNAQCSPDGRWIAYQSDESGRVEIYVQPFPGPGRRVQVSGEGGVQVRWRRDGRELFYLASGNRLMAVPIQLDEQTEAVEVGTPVPLFTPHLAGTPQGGSARHYMVSPDGQRFLVNALTETTLPITVILNWKPQS